MASLPIVHVCTESVDVTWPLLLQAVDKADLVALDLELSGLGNGKRGGSSIQERYDVFRGVVNSYSVLCVGVACFKWAWTDNTLQCHTEVFNVWLLCQQEYMLDPCSAKFLLQHGFDFNRQISTGLPYRPAPCEVSDLTSPSLSSLLARLLLARKPLILHNGLIDLMFLFHTFYHPLPPSVDTFMADLSQLFGTESGGVYDTKAIAEYLVQENASYLEYVFRKRQRENEYCQTRGDPHVVLSYSEYPTTCLPYTESVSITPAPPSPGVLAVRVCGTFAAKGFCHSPNCSLSHDVLVALAQEERHAEVERLKRKRVRELREARKRAKLAEGDGHMTQNRVVTDSDRDEKSSLLDIFESELKTVKTRLQDTQTETQTPSGTRPSFGHRAGYDAFMTGYAFTCYALSKANPDALSCSLTTSMFEGVQQLRGCLGNRGRALPLRIAKSHFSKPSKGYQETWKKLEARFLEQTKD